MPRKINVFLQFLTYGMLISLSQGSPLIGEKVRDAQPGELPFIVSLIERVKLSNTSYENREVCTGTLISRKSVLIAAHCLWIPLERAYIVAGSTNLLHGKIYNIESWITYDDWKATQNEIKEFDNNDVAIMTLEGEGVDQEIKPAAILTFDPTDLYGSQIRIAGWGNDEVGRKTYVLKTAVLKVISNENCNEIITKLIGRNITESLNQFCSLANPTVRTTCGDSGAPILNKRNQVVGIHLGSLPSFEYCLPRFRNEDRVNTHLHLYYYRDFIKDVIVST